MKEKGKKVQKQLLKYAGCFLLLFLITLTVLNLLFPLRLQLEQPRMQVLHRESREIGRAHV